MNIVYPKLGSQLIFSDLKEKGLILNKRGANGNKTNHGMTNR